MGLEIKISNKIDEIKNEDWDKLAEIFFMKTNILKIVENLELGKKSYYFQIYDDTELVGIAIAYEQKKKALYYTVQEILYSKYEKYSKPFLNLQKSLVCYFPYSPTYPMYKFKENYDQNLLFSMFLEKLNEIAKKEKYASSCVCGVIEDDFLKIAQKTNFSAFFSGFKIIIPINWKSMEEYKSSIKSHHRAIIKKEIKLFNESNFKLEILENINEHKEKIYSLFDGNFLKYNFSKTQVEMNKEFLDELIKTKKNIIYLIEKNEDDLVSALMLLEDDKRFISFRLGHEESCDEKGFSFFNLSIYKPIEYAIEKNKKIIELGSGCYTYKIRRGGQLVPTNILIRPTNNFKNLYLKPIIKILSKRNLKKHNSKLKSK